MVTVTVTGVAFGQPDAWGVTWHNQLEGWDDTPGTRSDKFSRIGAHGAVAGDWFYDERAIVWSGMADCPSEAAMWEAMERLGQMTDATDAETGFQVATARRTTTAQVRRDGSAKIRPLTDRVFEFQVNLTALDPVRYSTTLNTVGPNAIGTGVSSVVVDMGGTAWRVRPSQLIVTGGSGTQGIRFRNNTDDGALLMFDGPVVTAGEVITFDFATGVVNSSTRGPGVSMYVSSDSVWPDLKRDANNIDWWLVAGSATARLTWRDGFF